MTASDYADLLNTVAVESLQRAADLANAYDLADGLDDRVAAAGYLGQVKGINVVLDLISDGLEKIHG